MMVISISQGKRLICSTNSWAFILPTIQIQAVAYLRKIKSKLSEWRPYLLNSANGDRFFFYKFAFNLCSTDMKQNIRDLIPIENKGGKRAVSARMLHSFLESKQQFQDWIKNRITKYGFVENQDFEVFHKVMKNPNGGRPQDEYAISIEMAKELSMVENNEKGKMARQYFIRCEEIAKTKEGERLSVTSKNINAKISWIKGVKGLLRLNDNSVLMMLKQVGDPLGLPTPDYTKSADQILSAKELLKRHVKGISAQKFNKIAEEKGYIAYLSRPAAHGKTHRFPSITDKGKTFGENQVSPKNPSQTQPQWYVGKFGDLLKALGV